MSSTPRLRDVAFMILGSAVSCVFGLIESLQAKLKKRRRRCGNSCRSTPSGDAFTFQ